MYKTFREAVIEARGAYIVKHGDGYTLTDTRPEGTYARWQGDQLLIHMDDPINPWRIKHYPLTHERNPNGRLQS